MKRLYIITVLVALLSVSCNDWLDVRPDTEQKDKDLFTTYKGFQDALTGCYMSLASQDVYGERLTMSNIESLANLWYQFRNSTRYEDNDLMNHDYTGDYSKAAVKTIYAGLFNVIAQANMIIKYAEKNGDVIEAPAARAVITGERTPFVLFASWTCCVCSDKCHREPPGKWNYLILKQPRLMRCPLIIVLMITS